MVFRAHCTVAGVVGLAAVYCLDGRWRALLTNPHHVWIWIVLSVGAGTVGVWRATQVPQNWVERIAHLVSVIGLYVALAGAPPALSYSLTSDLLPGCLVFGLAAGAASFPWVGVADASRGVSVGKSTMAGVVGLLALVMALLLPGRAEARQSAEAVIILGYCLAIAAFLADAGMGGLRVVTRSLVSRTEQRFSAEQG